MLLFVDTVLKQAVEVSPGSCCIFLLCRIANADYPSLEAFVGACEEVGWSRVSPESDTKYNANVSPSAFYCPLQISFVFWTRGTGRLVLVWYAADAEDLSRIDTDHHGSNDGITGESVHLGQVSDATL